MLTDAIIAEGLRLDAEYVSSASSNLARYRAIAREEFLIHAANHYADALREVVRLRERDEAFSDVLRELASYVGNGGYNANEVDPEQFRLKIREGIDWLIKGNVNE